MPEFIRRFVFPKLKFATTSAMATGADYSIYLGLFYFASFEPVLSNVVSYSIGMVINFILQKRFIFSLNRNWKLAFAISACFSLVGLGVSTGFIYLLTQSNYLYTHQYLTKALVTGGMFFYNFYTKKFSFEKRFTDIQPQQTQH
jgi:putative flippase GtrA